MHVSNSFISFLCVCVCPVKSKNIALITVNIVCLCISGPQQRWRKHLKNIWGDCSELRGFSHILPTVLIVVSDVSRQICSCYLNQRCMLNIIVIEAWGSICLLKDSKCSFQVTWLSFQMNRYEFVHQNNVSFSSVVLRIG